METTMTLCTQCVFFRKLGPVWYSQFCAARPRERGTDPVTGAAGYVGVNDLGRRYITDTPYAYARDINPDGQCALFQARQD